MTPVPPPLLQVCAFSESLAEGAIKMGMPSGLAHRIAAQTLLVRPCCMARGVCGRGGSAWGGSQPACAETGCWGGELQTGCQHRPFPLNPNASTQGTAKVLLQKGQHPAQLRTDVCTPGGTTIYGLHVLEQGGLRATAMSAVEAATCRARELSRNPSPVVAQVPSVLQALQGEGALAHREHSRVWPVPRP